MNTKVNIYESVQETEPIREVEVAKVYDRIRNGAFKDETERVLELERDRLDGKAKEDDVKNAKTTLLKAASFIRLFSTIRRSCRSEYRPLHRSYQP